MANSRTCLFRRSFEFIALVFGLAALAVQAIAPICLSGFPAPHSTDGIQIVRDLGMRAPFDRMIPLVEMSLQKPLDYATQRITGTIAPGVLWAGQYVQISAEALVPLNGSSGHGIGFIAQLHFYIDDLFPQSLGRPLLGA